MSYKDHDWGDSDEKEVADIYQDPSKNKYGCTRKQCVDAINKCDMFRYKGNFSTFLNVLGNLIIYGMHFFLHGTDREYRSIYDAISYLMSRVLLNDKNALMHNVSPGNLSKIRQVFRVVECYAMVRNPWYGPDKRVQIPAYLYEQLLNDFYATYMIRIHRCYIYCLCDCECTCERDDELECGYECTIRINGIEEFIQKLTMASFSIDTKHRCIDKEDRCI